MSKRLNDWAEGRFPIVKPVLILSKNEISSEVQEKGSAADSLTLTSDTEGFLLKGRLYCDNPCIQFTQNSFEGEKIDLEYRILTEGLCRGDVLKGKIRFYTNLDIVDIPVTVRITEPFLTIGNSTVCDLEDFASLINRQSKLTEEIFRHNDFERVVLSSNPYAKSVSRLIRRNNHPPKEAVDRFAYALGLKDKPIISFADMAVSRFFAPLEQTGYSLELIRENESSIDISVECKESFLTFFKTVLTGEDFVGNRTVFTYFVNPSLLSEGLNEATIIFKNDLQELKYRVLIDNAVLSEMEKRKLSKKRRFVLALLNGYIDFRLGKTGKEEWAKTSLEYVNGLEKVSDDLFVKLYKVHLLLALNDTETSRQLLYSLDMESEKSSTNKAYFLYLVAFFKEDPEFALRLTEDLRKYRKEREDLFSLLWFLLYLDDDYVNSVSKRYKALKEQYRLSKGNVLLLCEAAVLLNKKPELLSEFTDFETEVCLFALKRDFMTGTLWNAVFHISSLSEGFSKGVFRLLCAGYDKYMTSDRLEKLASYCINGGCKGREYLPIYEQCIMQGSNPTLIYEYYLRSLSFDPERPILKQALHYFKYRSDLPDEDKAFLYANIVRCYSKDEIFSEYRSYVKEFTLNMVLNKRIDESLLYLYHHVLQVEDVNAVNVNETAFLCLLALVRVENDRAVNIVVSDSRLNENLRANLTNSMAVVPICSDDVCIAFEDEEGKLFIDKDSVKISRLLNRPDLLQACKNYQPTCFEYLLYVNDAKGLLASPKLDEEYRLYCNNEASRYYSENPYDKEALNFIEQVEDRLLCLEAKAGVIGLNIIYNRLNVAVRLMTAFGYHYVNPAQLMNFCETVIRLEDAESFRKLSDDSWLLHLSAYLYERGIRSTKLITLLSVGYEGTLQELLKLWESAGSLQIERKLLEERILQLCCFLRDADSKVLDVYESYTKGQINKKTALGYLSLLSFDSYILKSRRRNRKRVFFHVVNYYMNFKRISGICQLAALDYLSDSQDLTEDDKEFVTAVIKEHVSSGIYFDVFESFTRVLEEKKVELVFKRQKHFVTHMDEPGRLIFIKYRLLNGEGEPISVMQSFERGSMKEIYPGIYIKDFILFAGEIAEYVIMGFDKDVEIELCSTRIRAGKRKNRQFNKDRYDMVEELLMSKTAQEREENRKKISTLDVVNKELFLLR